MTTAVTLNPFELLGDNDVDDPEVISATIKKPEPAKAAPAAAPSPEKPKKPVSQGNKESTAAPEGGRGGRGRGARGGRGGRGGRGRGSAPGQDEEVLEITTPEGLEHYRESGRGGRGTRGGRGRGGRREYDRHDGTGRAHEGPKRGGAGKGNWGVEGEGEELLAALSLEEDPSAVQQENVADNNGEEAAPAESEEPKEPEPELIGLEDYFKIQEEKRVGLNKVGTVAEVDSSQFDGMASVHRPKAEDSDVLAVSATKSKKERQRREKDAKGTVITDLGFSTRDDSSRGERRGRGDRRGGRGGGRGFGRGSGRGGYEDADGGESFGRGRGGRGSRGRGGGRGGYTEDGAGGYEGNQLEDAVADADGEDVGGYTGGRGRGGGRSGFGARGGGRGSGRYRDSGAGASSAPAPDLSLGDENFPSLG